ncbi:MAG TPA: protein kinase, partial [Gemmatimonadaceae bacterium]
MPIREAIARSLARRYRIERELGRGGFAVVFLAHDLRHDRPVALKVLHEDVAATLGAERFEREIRLAARLQHPHILGVFDSGEAAGRLWFTMPFIEGESLRDRITREKQLPVADAVALAREVADALDYAHQHGVIHRDIKPENILLSGRHAIVADFGIARALATPADGGLTQTGVSIGTPGYMSPEQATGERQLDARSDVYALACVLYEMIAGEPPFTGPNVQAVIARMLTETPRSLRGARAGMTDALDVAVARGLARVPADRFASAAAFSSALESAATTHHVAVSSTLTSASARVTRFWRRPTFAVFALGILIGVGGLFAWRRSHGDAEGRTLAVLPFENIGANDDAYFADGITEEVRGKLAGIPGLRVTARTSANQYRGSKKTPAEIGAELGVSYLLTGTVRWATAADGKRTVRVTPELIRVATGSTKWQQGFDNELSDVFTTQTKIAEQVAQELDVQIGTSVQQQFASQPTQNLEAYQEFLLGEQATQSFALTDPRSMEAGLVHYQRAAQLDSGFANAWAAIARIKTTLYGNSPDARLDAEALAAVDRVRRLDPNSANTHRVMAFYYRSVKKEFRAAYDEIMNGLRSSPNEADLLISAASAENSLGLFDSALVHVQRARRIDPRAAATMRMHATVLGYLRRYPEAIVEWDRLLAASPTNADAVQSKVRIQALMGDLPAAKHTIAEALKHVDSTALAIRFAYYQEMMWLLDP